MFRVQTERIYELVMSRKSLLCIQNMRIIYTIHVAYYDNRDKLTDIEKTVCEHIFIDLSHQKNTQDS